MLHSTHFLEIGTFQLSTYVYDFVHGDSVKLHWIDVASNADGSLDFVWSCADVENTANVVAHTAAEKEQTGWYC